MLKILRTISAISPRDALGGTYEVVDPTVAEAEIDEAVRIARKTRAKRMQAAQESQEVAMRVVIDTSVFVSGLMLPASVPGRILAAAIVGGFEIVLCEAMLEEISTPPRCPKVRKRIALSDDELNQYVQALRFRAKVVVPAGVVVQVPGDRDDEVILATLVVAKADWLVTGDSPLLALADRYPIVTPAAFLARHL